MRILACEIIDLFYTLLNRCIHGVINGITGPAAHVDPAQVAAPAGETAPVTPGGLAEWNGRYII